MAIHSERRGSTYRRGLDPGLGWITRCWFCLYLLVRVSVGFSAEDRQSAAWRPRRILVVPLLLSRDGHNARPGRSGANAKLASPPVSDTYSDRLFTRDRQHHMGCADISSARPNEESREEDTYSRVR